MSKTQTVEDRKNGKWSHESTVESFLRALREDKPEVKPQDTSKPLIVVDKELEIYFHY